MGRASRPISASFEGKDATGYKYTDIGTIPEDWDIYNLQDIANQFVNGGAPSTKNEDFWSGNIPWITGADILDQEVAVIRRHITAKAVDSSSTNVIPKGNLLIVSRTGVGKLAIAPCDIAISQDFTGIILRKEKILVEYLFRYLDFFQNVLVKQNQGTSIKGITRDTLAAILIAVPSPVEQRAIAETLSDADSLIKSLEALVAKKKALKQATMQQLLTGKTRLLGFSGAWEMKTIGEVADIKNGATPSTRISAYWGGHIPWCTPTDITTTSGKYLLTTARNVTMAGLASCSASLLPSGTLLLCSRATIGEIKIAASDVCTNQGFKSLVCKDDVSNEFLYYLLLLLKPKIIERAVGSTFLEIIKHDVASIELVVPNYSEQRAIAAILSDMDAEIASLEQRLDKTRAIKQGMMQRLLTGRIRLMSPEASTGDSAKTRTSKKSHSPQFNEAVVISVLTKHFGSKKFPLGRIRYTKLSYLLHRRKDGQVEGYLKKAAGPYNPSTRYGGPEKIALKNDYIREHESGKYQGFITGANINAAERYFCEWYGNEALQWLENFRYKKNDDLELLTTVDMATEELYQAGKEVSVESVREALRDHPEWKAKLDRPIFSDGNIAGAIKHCQNLFNPDYEGRKS